MTQKNSVYDYETNTDKFYGMYRGVVECRHDPDRLCRCKIRVWGVHDEEKVKTPKKGVPTHELPWAEPAYGLYMGSVSGNGIWTVPLQGSYVWVFFENGNWMQPRYFATIPAMPIDPPNGEEGFNDPMEEFPRGDWLEEPDTHRLMKRDKLGETTLLEVKEPSVDEDVDIAIGGSWTEHPPMYQAEYPFNTVMYSHSGIYTEIDDTEDNRRYHIYHPSNSYIEIGEKGEMVIRNAEKRWDICDDMKFEHVMDDYHRKIDNNRTSLVEGSQWDHIVETCYTYVEDDKISVIDGDFIEYSGDRDIRSGGAITLTASTAIVIEAPIVTIKSGVCTIHSAYTEISDTFKWGGMALGVCDMTEHDVYSELPNIPIEPDIPDPEPPPEPPELDYDDIPPEPEPCPPDECPEIESVIV